MVRALFLRALRQINLAHIIDLLRRSMQDTIPCCIEKAPINCL